MADIETALIEAKMIADQLLAAESLYFSDLVPSDIPKGISGVYAIFDKDTKETLYVGRSKNLQQRLYTNHLHGPKTNARLKKYLVEDETQQGIKTMDDAKKYLKDHCYAKYIIESDTVQRGKIEGLLSFLLDVRYIHEEH